MGTPRFANSIIDLLKKQYGLVILRNCDIKWPAKTSDLTQWDYSLIL